jgi:glyoxylase-like metal-dependent hydrolase (beta-lactamase superfamily II)
VPRPTGARTIRGMLETRPGVWFWQSQHPNWVPDDGWDEIVSSYALDDGEQLIVIDPLAPPPELEELASKRQTTIALTCQWHRRDSEDLAARLGATIYVPAPNPEDDREPVKGERYAPGDTLPGGIKVICGLDETDLVLWSRDHAAIAVGDVLVDRGEGLVLPLDWADKRSGPEPITARLRPLLDAGVEVVLPGHGLPTDRAALARALGLT